MLQFILHILGYDIWFYISHILLHITPLWKYHKTHHLIIHPKYTDTYTGHVFESFFQSLGFFAPYIYFHFDITSLLLAATFVNLRGMMRHDSRTIWLISNHHLLHHEFFNCNYGEYWIDTLFKTSIKATHHVKKGLLYV